jgi:hypothetical protein
MIVEVYKAEGDQQFSSDHIINFSGQITKKLPSRIMVMRHKTCDYYYYIFIDDIDCRPLLLLCPCLLILIFSFFYCIGYYILLYCKFDLMVFYNYCFDFIWLCLTHLFQSFHLVVKRLLSQSIQLDTCLS